MSYVDNIRCISLPVNSDQSASKNKFAKGNGDGIQACDTAGEAALGIFTSNDGKAAGRAVEVAIGGAPKVVAGSALPRWSEIASSATGQAVVAVAGDVVLGVNTEAAAAQGDVVNMTWGPSYIKAA